VSRRTIKKVIQRGFKEEFIQIENMILRSPDNSCTLDLDFQQEMIPEDETLGGNKHTNNFVDSLE
jgi:hypothetical protein